MRTLLVCYLFLLPLSTTQAQSSFGFGSTSSHALGFSYTRPTISPAATGDRPMNIEEYYGTPGNWTLRETDTYTYTPWGDYSTISKTLADSTRPYSTTNYRYNTNNLLEHVEVMQGSYTYARDLTYQYGPGGRIDAATILYSQGQVISDTVMSNFYYDGNNHVDSMIQFNRNYKQRWIYRHNASGSLIGYGEYTQQAPSTTFIQRFDISDLTISFGFGDFNMYRDFIVGNGAGFNLNSEPNPGIILTGVGLTFVDSLNRSVPIRITGNQSGLRATNLAEYQISNNNWAPHQAQTLEINAHDDNTELKIQGYYLAGNPRSNPQWNQYTLTYDSFGHLIEKLNTDLRFNPTSPTQRFVYSQFATVATRPLSIPALQAYPNPARQVLHITGLAGGTPYQILDIQGREASQGQLAPGGAIYIQALKTGLYLLRAAGRQVRILVQ